MYPLPVISCRHCLHTCDMVTAVSRGEPVYPGGGGGWSSQVASYVASLKMRPRTSGGIPEIEHRILASDCALSKWLELIVVAGKGSLVCGAVVDYTTKH